MLSAFLRVNIIISIMSFIRAICNNLMPEQQTQIFIVFVDKSKINNNDNNNNNNSNNINHNKNNSKGKKNADEGGLL